MTLYQDRVHLGDDRHPVRALFLLQLHMHARDVLVRIFQGDTAGRVAADGDRQRLEIASLKERRAPRLLGEDLDGYRHEGMRSRVYSRFFGVGTSQVPSVRAKLYHFSASA